MTGSDRKALGIGAVVVALALAWRTVPYLWTVGEGLATVTHQDIALAKQSVATAARASNTARLLHARADEFISLAGHFWGNSAPDGTAAITASVDSWAADHKVTVASVQPLPDSLFGPFRRVGITISGEGDLKGISGLIRRIETSSQLLSIGRLALIAQGDPNATPQHMSIEAQIYGWIIQGQDP